MRVRREDIVAIGVSAWMCEATFLRNEEQGKKHSFPIPPIVFMLGYAPASKGVGLPASDRSQEVFSLGTRLG
jgi:hypothetical protein